MSSFDFFFILAALVSGVFAIFAVTTKHILRAAVYLMIVLSMSAVFYLLLGAEYLAGIQLLVYVGGIVVLLVFAVMLTRSEDLIEDVPSIPRKFFAIIASGSFFVCGIFFFYAAPIANLKEPQEQLEPVKTIGKALLDTTGKGYVLPFEVISLLLLAVLISGVVLAKKESES